MPTGAVFRVPSALAILAAVTLFIPSRVWPQAQEKRAQQYYEQAEKALAENRFDLAADGYRKLAEISPGIAEIHAKLGWIYYQMGRFDSALPAFEHALKTKPTLSSAEVLLAVCWSELGRFEQAVPVLEKHFDKPPDAVFKRVIGLELQRGYLGLKRFNDAAAMALKMVQLFPADPEVIYHTGKLFGDFSFVTMQRLHDLAPESVWTHLASAEAYEGQGDFELAIVEYRKVLALEPRRAGIRVRVGRILRHDIQPEAPLAEAQQEFEQELEIDPTNATAAYELGEIHRITGNSAKGLEMLRLAIRTYPDYAAAHVALARLLIQLKDFRAALPHLRQAVQLDAENETSHYLLAQVHQALGDSQNQKKELAEFERLKSQRVARQNTSQVEE